MSQPQPLFNKNRSELLSRLRLSQSDSEDAVAAIDAALAAVAIGFYDRLGTEVDVIKAIAYTSDASAGESARRRLRAATIEEKWVRYELMRSMPVLFFEFSGAQDRWNEEEMGTDARRVERELRRLLDDINTGLDYLMGSTDSEGIQAMTFGPDTTPVYTPGGSVQSPIVSRNNSE